MRASCTNRSKRFLVGAAATLTATLIFTISAECAGPIDYSKRAVALDESIQTALLGRWTNPGDNLIIEIDSVDLTSGKLSGKAQPTSGPAAADDHELTGWVSA